MGITKLENILNQYRKISKNNRQQGDKFERLMQAYLLTDPTYANNFEKVWLWSEFSAADQFGGNDIGIDIVAKTHTGEYWAVQCKFFDEATTVSKAQVDTFISTANKSFIVDDVPTHFSQLLWISTQYQFSKHFSETIKGQRIPTNHLNRHDLETAPVDWEQLEQGAHGKIARTTSYSLRPHQQVAVDKSLTHFESHRRGKLIMACGTGKTYTALNVMERYKNQFNTAQKPTLVLVPSIALVGQLLREWTANATIPINPICVCSDPKVSARTGKQQDIDAYSVTELGYPASTEPEIIANQHSLYIRTLATRDNYTVIFSTYQSIEAIEKAQKNYGLPDFDLIICDEAHRTTGIKETGKDETAFIRVHDDNLIKADKRLYMTATPRLYNEESKTKAYKNNAILASMDDAETYGEEIHRIGFGEAVEAGLLTDYKVLIFTVSDKDIPLAFQNALSDQDGKIEADTQAKLIGAINALSKQIIGEGTDSLSEQDPHPMKTAVAFCRTIENSKAISKLFTEESKNYTDAVTHQRKENLVQVTSKHIDGSMRATEREQLLAWLKKDENQTGETPKAKVLTNVRCLSEGVDVPSLDAVMFLSPRNSQVDVVQSVGRVMRKSEGKKYGYIIIPVMVQSDVDPDKALDENKDFATVWSVLNALRAHDDRFNATVNKIELNKTKPDSIIIGGVPPYEGEPTSSSSKSTDSTDSSLHQINLDQFQNLQNLIYARLVQKVGERRYWQEWAKSVANIAQKQIENITHIVGTTDANATFAGFLLEMQTSIDANITKDTAIEMLAQHIITAPVFNALFENYDFARNNAISTAMELILEDIHKYSDISEDTKDLAKFYESVAKRASGIDNAEGKQKIIIELYDTFFKAAFPKMSEMLGIVYTPIEVVDFIIHSVNDVLRAEFGKTYNDSGVTILDPFTGTGTFITRLLQSGLIHRSKLKEKYQNEIFANEIVLLAYYIASVNIENVYYEIANKYGDESSYTPFNGISLTDTFKEFSEAHSTVGQEYVDTTLLSENTTRVRKQNQSRVTVIMGNPPYSVGQKKANDNAQNQKYKSLDEAIRNTYVKLTKNSKQTRLYDSYIRAFRYATDRLVDENGHSIDGIIAFVSNGTWLDGNATEGFRKSLEQEFSKIYVFNLRGNQRTDGELSRKEGGKIFGSGSRTPVTITLLVKNATLNQDKATIYYRDIGDYLRREDKLDILVRSHSFLSPSMKNQLVSLHPSTDGDWILNRNEIFQEYLSIGSDFFSFSVVGLNSNRDAYVYNFSKEKLKQNIQNTINRYNQSLGKNVDYKDSNIAWTRGLVQCHARKIRINYEENQISLSSYRPFTKIPLYHGDRMIEMPSRNLKAFPTADIENRMIIVSGVSSKKDFACLITDGISNLNALTATQGFPLYHYTTNESSENQLTLETNNIPTDSFTRHDAITDHILTTAHTQYANDAISKTDIFYYVYGILHSPAYRTTFADDLKKSLPRLPLVKNYTDFETFSSAGRQLADLHINYEQVAPIPTVTVAINGVIDDHMTNHGETKRPSNPDLYHVAKIKYIKKGDKSTIIYNGNISISNIPATAFDYVINGKSAIDWILDRYQVKTDKASGIVNNPNDYAREQEKPRYILDLLLSVMSVSAQTNEIVDALPVIDWSTS